MLLHRSFPARLIPLLSVRYFLNIICMPTLQIGYRSMMRGSQSISDLTNAIETPIDSRISEHSGTISAQGKIFRFALAYGVY